MDFEVGVWFFKARLFLEISPPKLLSVQYIRVHVDPVGRNVQGDEALEQKRVLLPTLPLAVEARQLHEHERCGAPVCDHVEDRPELGACGTGRSNNHNDSKCYWE